jgi:hypothetical protein
MGLMRFKIHPPGRITADLADQAYLSSFDMSTRRVWRTFENGQLLLHRDVSDSATLHIPWPVEGRGPLVLCTGCLIEQQRPYFLPLELARGTVGLLRNQAAEWRRLGLHIPDAVIDRMEETVKMVAKAAISQEDVEGSSALAERTIRMALDVSDLLTEIYVNWTMAKAARRAEGKRMLLGGELGDWVPPEESTQPLLLAFNSAGVSFPWPHIETAAGNFDWAVRDKQIQWCREYGLPVLGGPLLRLDKLGLPPWFSSSEKNADRALGAAADFIRAAVMRYRGKVDLWQCTARVNSSDVFNLTEEEKFRLVVQSCEQVHWLDPRTPILIGFDQPWAEYMSRRRTELTPLEVAGALIRAGLSVQGFMLEINLGYHPDGTLPRGLLSFSKQLDLWALLGLPLWISLCVPAGSDDDPKALLDEKITPRAWTPVDQADWIADYLPLIVSKPYVQGVFWNQLCDGQPHAYPHGGLFDAEERPKPALSTLASIRRTFLWD